MFSIEPTVLPEDALLQVYAERDDCYADCYSTEISESVSLVRYVSAFYTTPVFRMERLVLRMFASAPSSDIEAQQMASGERRSFAAWRVEKRSDNQLLMCDFSGRTRSWFKVEHPDGRSGAKLFFGSTVVPAADSEPGAGLGLVFNALLGFHKVYSRVLLASAKVRLQKQVNG